MKRKAIFDTLRKILGRGFPQSEVVTIDDVLDAAMASACDSAWAKRNSTKQLSPSSTCFKLIKRFEGCASLRPDGLIEAYPDPGTGDAPWTIGWGAAGADIGPGTVWTQAECEARLTADIERQAAEIANALGNTPTSQAEFDAMVSFHYNTGAIHRATLTAKHRSGDKLGVIEEFARWNRAGGRVLKSIVSPRQAEARTYASQKA